MYNILFSAFAGMACVGALLAAGAFSSADAQLAGPSAPVPAESVQEPSRVAVEQAASPPPKRTRARATLSMPYFSFAQSLRTRG